MGSHTGIMDMPTNKSEWNSLDWARGFVWWHALLAMLISLTATRLVAQTADFRLGATSLWEGNTPGKDSVLLVSASPTNSWTAVADASWLHLSAGHDTGIGGTNVVFTYDANSGATRTATLTIAGQTLSVIQAGSQYAAANQVGTLVSLGFNFPFSVAVDDNGDIYTQTAYYKTVYKWVAASNTLVPALSSGLSSPIGLALDPSGNLYIGDYGANALKKWSITNQALTTLVSSGLSFPEGIALDASGNVYVADYGNNDIKEWLANGSGMNTVISGLNQPTDVALDSVGNVYVTDAGNNAIKKWSALTHSVSTVVSGLSSPTGVALDGSGNIYIADSLSGSIKKWSAVSNTVTTLVFSDWQYYPQGVAVDKAGDIIFTGTSTIKELPHAFVDMGGRLELPRSGSDQWRAVLPSTSYLKGAFTPASDADWLTFNGSTDGVVSVSFAENAGLARTGHLAVLGQSIPVTQAGPTFVQTAPAEGTNDQAVLNGAILPDGLPTSAWFEWFADGEPTNTTTPTPVGSGVTNVPLAAVLTKIHSGVVYHYRVVATNAAGLSVGAFKLFQTPQVVLNGTPVMTNECHAAFTDPEARSMAAPLAVAGGDDHSLALKSDGTVAAWGLNSEGQTLVPGDLSNVVAVAAGAAHSLALEDSGRVIGWGRDSEGETTPPPGLSNVVAIAAGEFYSLALGSNGVVTAWGSNAYGQTNVPSGLTDVVAIAAGGFHALALREDGSVIGWGNDADGETDIPANLTHVVAIAAGENQSLALKDDGTVVGWGQTTIPPGLTNVVAVACGLFHNLALKSDGTVVGWGADSYGQASGLNGLTNVTAVSSGGYHSLAITRDGKLVAAGYDLYGQTNIPTTLGGNIIETGLVDPNDPGIYELTYIASNALGGVGTATRTVVVVDTTPPTLQLLGANPLFLPVNTAFADPGAIAEDTCAGDLTSDIVVTGWVNTSVLGTNVLSYSVADDSGNVARTNRIIIKVPGRPFVTTFGPGEGQEGTALRGAVNPNGDPTAAWFQWGTNILYGRTTGPVEVGQGLTNVPMETWLSGLTPGVSYHYRLVATNSEGWAYSRDAIFRVSSNELPTPVLMLRGPEVITNECHTVFNDPGAFVLAPLAGIAAGDHYSLALKSDGTVADWGNGPRVPAGLSNVTAVAAGYIHSLALKADGTVVGWGDNTFTETNTPQGLTDVVSIAAGWGYSLALKGDGTLVAWGTNNFTPAPIPPGLDQVTAIAAGFDLCLAVKEDGTVVGWGNPPFGGTTPPAGLSNVVAVAAGESFGLALKSDGTVEGWGYDAEGQADVPEGLSNVVAIAAGFYHSLALKADGTVMGWGDNFYGESTPPTGLNNVIAIAAGAYHSLALKADGTVVGWGLDSNGETDITTANTNLATSAQMNFGTIYTNDPGSYVLVYLATNDLGLVSALARTVDVVDTIPPAITLNGGAKMNALEGTPFQDPGATAIDACAGLLPVTISNTVNVATPGTYTNTYVATDSSGNSATNARVVTVLIPGPVKLLLPQSSDGNFTFGFQTVPDLSYTIEQNTNLDSTSWDIYGRFIGNGFVAHVRLPIQTNIPQAFYRVKQP
jgi:alpha-tubulin suppressor-like RCC1 family protein